MSDEAVETEEKSEKKGGNGLIVVLLIVIILLLVGVGALAFLMLSGGDKESKSDDAAAHGEASHGDEADDHGDEHGDGHAQSYSPKYKQFPEPLAGLPPGYFTMDKFVVNFNGGGKAKFLAVDLKFMSYYPELVGDDGEMEHLRPILKNDIQRLLRGQTFAQLDTADGPDHLRAELLKVVRHVLEKHNIYPDLVEDVYMTRFVMQ